ncbi:MAG: hypothetical protein PHV20_05890 [Bacteroidales bacterium]|nr:hypothetical protein [Bacteroidales bacterium]
MEDKILNEKESLELISKMIQNSQQKIKAGNGVTFLIFGYTTLLVSVVVYYLLKTTHNQLYNLVWLGIPVIGFTLLYLFRKDKPKYNKTYIDRVISNVWLVVGSGVFFVSFAAGFVRIPVLAVLILLLGIATTITGLVIKFKPVVIGGVLGMLSFILPFILLGYEQVLAYGICVFIMMVIPGHILNYKRGKKNV